MTPRRRRLATVSDEEASEGTRSPDFAQQERRSPTGWASFLVMRQVRLVGI